MKNTMRNLWKLTGASVKKHYFIKGTQNMNGKKFKVMAYIMSSGLWDAFGSISLEQLLGFRDEKLAVRLQDWQDMYDDQFKRNPYSFDWKRFNEIGEELTRCLKEKLPEQAEIVYEPSDDRDFFSPEDCKAVHGIVTSLNDREIDLRERKRALLYDHVAWSE